jgi:ubiquinone/menaquinone biosynthesis C-methylase UbiE
MSSSEAGRAAPSAPDFGPLAESYDRLRPVDRNWHELVELLVEAGDLAGRRVLDVGAGTGALAAALVERGSRVWGVDAAPEMVAVANRGASRTARFKEGKAEALPFKDGWFERAVLRLVVHLVDRALALPEVARVLAPGGRAVVATFDPAHFSGFWLNRIFPSIERIDRARFPEPDRLAGELEEAGFADVETRGLVQRSTILRAEALERIRGRYISTLRLLDDDELESGTAAAERELPETIAIELHWAVLVAKRA